MTRPDEELRGVLHATEAVFASLGELGDEQASEPSVLPGWTRAEVITHLARHADSETRMVEAAARGEVGVQYPGGAEQRAAEIAQGRGRCAADLVADLRSAHDALRVAWEKLPDDSWDRPGRAFAGLRPVREGVWARWREVEVHHVDLDLGFAPSDWPVRFVESALEATLTSLPARERRDRPKLDACWEIEAVDHGCAWLVELDGSHVRVTRSRLEGEIAAAGHIPDAVVSGWGCDVLAWLLGRRGAGALVQVSGADPTRALLLPSWFPFP